MHVWHERSLDYFGFRLGWFFTWHSFIWYDITVAISSRKSFFHTSYHTAYLVAIVQLKDIQITLANEVRYVLLSWIHVLKCTFSNVYFFQSMWLAYRFNGRRSKIKICNSSTKFLLKDQTLPYRRDYVFLSVLYLSWLRIIKDDHLDTCIGFLRSQSLHHLNPWHFLKLFGKMHLECHILIASTVVLQTDFYTNIKQLPFD